MSCSLHSVDLPKPKPVRINGIELPREKISRESQLHPARSPLQAWQNAARALVIRQLLITEAKRLEIKAAPLSEGSRTETTDEALIRQLLDQEIVTPEPDRAVCRRYYEQHAARFRSATIYEASHILIAADKRDVFAYRIAQEKIEKLAAELQLFPEKFETFAALYSACPSAEQGGNLGQLTVGQTTREFEEALLSLANGEISCPVDSRYGLHIVRLQRKIEGNQIPFEAAYMQIEEYLRESVKRRASAHYIAHLASRPQIEGIDLASAIDHRVN